MKIFKKKGFTLLELLLAVGVIGILTAATYSYMTKKQLIAEAQTQVKEILEMDQSIQQLMANVPVDNTLGVAKINEMLTPAKIIQQNMAPIGRANAGGTEIRNTFKNGTITFSAEALNVSNINTRIVPVYNYTITQVPPAACSFIVANFDLQEFIRIRVDGTTIKNVGETVSPTQAATACNGSTNKTIVITQSSVATKPEHGTNVVNLNGIAGHIRDTENQYYQEQLRTTTVAPGTCPAGSWNSALSFCSCPAGTEWNGKICISFGQPGVCPSGQMWNAQTSMCQAIVKLPFADATSHYENGRYVPNYAENPLGMPSGQGYFACEGDLPPNAAPPTNTGGTFDGSICNKCINGEWNGARCVLPYVIN